MKQQTKTIFGLPLTNNKRAAARFVGLAVGGKGENQQFFTIPFGPLCAQLFFFFSINVNVSVKSQANSVCVYWTINNIKNKLLALGEQERNVCVWQTFPHLTAFTRDSKQQH